MRSFYRVFGAGQLDGGLPFAAPTPQTYNIYVNLTGHYCGSTVMVSRCRRWTLFLLPIVLLTPVATSRGQALDEPLDAAQVIGAIDRAKAYLKREQNPRGQWDDMSSYEAGVTSLCTLALLSAGVEPTDPTVSKALGYLRSIELEKTYTVSLQTMVLCAAEPKKDLVQIQRNVDWLERHQNKDGGRSGSWSYPGPGGDNSNSQFAILALHDAQQVGAKVRRETWERSAKYWRDCQNPDGSWGYLPNANGYGSMTCAGIAALVITAEALEAGDANVRDGKVNCCLPHRDDDQIEKGINWLGRHFSVRRNPAQGSQWHYYYLYGLERVGRLTARRFIGDHDWYREGADYLVAEQDPLGQYWKGSGHAENNPHLSTALGLLFLAKGRWPILMGKVKYGDDEGWNNHRRDAAHLTVYTQKVWDMPLTWQVLDPSKASVEDLLQAPVLYISGDETPQLLNIASKLRDYVDRGGFIFAEATCQNSAAFDEGFRKLIEAMFPEPEYRLQQLRPAHPLWRMEKLVRPDSPYVGKLWAVEYGCRTCIVYCQEDLSCYWELDAPIRRDNYPDAVKQHIEDANTVGINVLTYATNREPKGKEQSFVLDLDDEISSKHGARGVIQVAKLRHGGGCNDAPGALVNLMRAAGQGDAKLRVSTAGQMISAGDPSLFNYHLVFAHGRHDFRFTPQERDQLRMFLTEREGTLLADSICASKAFTSAFRRELGAVLPEHRLEQIPPDDPIFTEEYGGYDIRRVELRDPQPQSDDRPLAARVRRTEPQLEGIRIDGRWAVIFSPFDISCALEKHEAVECRGYSREDAARIGLNVLLYSLNQ